MSNLKCISKSNDTIITLQELKDVLYIEDDFENTRYNNLLKQTRDFVEKQTNRVYTNQVWLQINPWFCSKLMIRKPNVNTLSIQYYDVDNTLQTLDTAAYFFSDDFIYITNPPETFSRDDAVQITLNITAPDYISNEVKQLCLQVAVHLNANRGDTEVKIPPMIDRLVQVGRRDFI